MHRLVTITGTSQLEKFVGHHLEYKRAKSISVRTLNQPIKAIGRKDPPYSPDLAPFNFLLFLHQNKILTENPVRSNEEVMIEVNECSSIIALRLWNLFIREISNISLKSKKRYVSLIRQEQLKKYLHIAKPEYGYPILCGNQKISVILLDLLIRMIQQQCALEVEKRSEDEFTPDFEKYSESSFDFFTN